MESYGCAGWGANTLAEMAGLGASFLVFYLIFSLGEPRACCRRQR